MYINSNLLSSRNSNVYNCIINCLCADKVSDVETIRELKTNPQRPLLSRITRFFHSNNSQKKSSQEQAFEALLQTPTISQLPELETLDNKPFIKSLADFIVCVVLTKRELIISSSPANNKDTNQQKEVRRLRQLILTNLSNAGSIEIGMSPPAAVLMLIHSFITAVLSGIGPLGLTGVTLTGMIASLTVLLNGPLGTLIYFAMSQQRLKKMNMRDKYNQGAVVPPVVLEAAGYIVEHFGNKNPNVLETVKDKMDIFLVYMVPSK